MQWTPGAQAGFTTGTPFRKPNANYTNFNVETETADPSSLLNHYKKLIAARNSSSALNLGEFLPVRNSYAGVVYSALRVYQNESVLVAVNFGTRVRTLRSILPDAGRG
jgi:glycosidase